MCGLVGIAGNIENVDLDVFKDLLWIDAIRGMDNTGVASVLYTKPTDVRLLKVQGGPDQLFDRKSLVDVITHGSMFLMGHNRSRTSGSTEFKNAHPFHFEHLVGAHNGTLDWQTKNRLRGIFDTDSETLFNTINLIGVDEAVKMMMHPRDAWSLTWYDKRTKQLNFLRNKERPMYWVLDKDSRSTLYWASDPTMLYLVLNKYGIEIEKVHANPENILVTWQMNDKAAIELAKPTHRRVEAPPFVQPVNTGRVPPTQEEIERRRQALRVRHFGPNTSTTTTPSTITKGHNLEANMCELPFEPDSLKPGAEFHGADGSYVYVKGILVKKTDDVVQQIIKTAVDRKGEQADIVENMTRAMTAEEAFAFETRLMEHGSRQIIPPVTDQELSELVAKGKLKFDYMTAGGRNGSHYVGYDGQKFNRHQFEHKMQDGCVVCPIVPSWGEPVKFLKDGAFICYECLTSERTKRTALGLIRNML
jgi:hypothetical protein